MTLEIIDTATHRVCGTCEQAKPVEEFYSDGKDRDGNKKYRRDCKDCYRKTRLTERRAKKEPIKPEKKRGRRK